MFVLMLTALMLMASMAIPALAANTSDVDFWNYTALAYGYTRIPGRQKTNTTPVYVCVSQSNCAFVRVRAYGQNSSGSNYQNCTLSNGSLVDYVYCYRGIHHSIRSMINEYGWGYASLGFKSGYDSSSDVVSGWWSPDSGQTHTVATN
jgi:hypothetical protein